MTPSKTRKYILIPAMSFFCKIVLKVLGFKIELSGNFDVEDGTVMVANHLSFIDMLLMQAVGKGCFISTVEVQRTPFIGQIAELSGAMFIERRNRDNLAEEVRKVRANLDDGINVGFFPEAKSTNGDELLRFRRPFFKPAVDKKMDILAVALNYNTINDIHEVDATNRAKVLWYRQNAIFAQVWNILSYRSIEVSIHGEIAKASEYLKSEKHAADFCHDLIAPSCKLYNYTARI
jgi:1-acyl-sn-glycerol-3-phosphate acyltransferase